MLVSTIEENRESIPRIVCAPHVVMYSLVGFCLLFAEDVRVGVPKRAPVAQKIKLMQAEVSRTFAQQGGHAMRATPIITGHESGDSGPVGTQVMQDSISRFVSQGVELAMKISQLPAVPTAGWCRQAAAAIAPLGDFERSAVGIARVSHGGAMLEAILSVGVHVPSAPSEHLEESLLRAKRTTWLPTGVHADITKPWAIAVDAETMRRSTGGPWSLTISPRLALATAPFGEGCADHVLFVAVGSSDTNLASSPLLTALRALTDLLAKRAKTAMGCPDKPIRWVSPREQEVLELLIEGMSVKEIGESLGRSPHTITDHLKSLHRKLNANSRGELVAKALGRSSTRKIVTPTAEAADENWG